MLRARHLPFPIGIVEREQWLTCIQQAMQAVGIEARLQKELAQAFAKTADHMRNKEA